MVEDQVPNWLAIVLKGAPGPRPPDLGSERIKELAGRGLLSPRTLTIEDVQEMSAAIIGHLQSRKAHVDGNVHMGGNVDVDGKAHVDGAA